MKRYSIKLWITHAFFIILILAMLLSAVANLHQAYVNTMQQDLQLMTICAQNVQSLLDHQWGLEELQESPDSALYQGAREVLQQICRNYQLAYLYIYSIDPAGPSRYYYIGVSPDADEDITVKDEMSLRAWPADRILPAEQALMNGSKGLQQGHESSLFIRGITWFAPYKDSNGELRALIGMEYSSAEIRTKILTDFLKDIIPFTLSLTMGLLLLLHLVERRIVMPIDALSSSMKLFARDSRKKPEPLHIPPRDEIGEIAASYEKMTEDISTYVNNIEVLTRKMMETNIQLGIARRIQNGLVPENMHLSGAGFDIYAMTSPAREVGGDFYDCFRRDEGSICLVMGDVSGKGISAAICMSMLKTVIREKLIAGLSPSEALSETNEEFWEHNPENLFATVFVAVLNPFTGELRYTNAGHTRPVLLKEEPAFLMPEIGIALGLFEDAELTDQTLMLCPDQGILLYTDGITEAVNTDKQFFGEGKLLDTAKGFSADTDTAEKIVTRIKQAVLTFCEGSEPFDDMAALALVYHGVVEKSLAVALSSFDVIKKTVFTAAGDTPEVRRALLACDEALTNIVSYSGAKALTFSCEKQDGLLHITFSDDGVPFDPTAAQSEEKDFDLLDSGGMGLNLIRQTASSMHYERKNGQNVFSLYFSL